MNSTGTGLASRRGRKAIPWRRYWETVLSGVIPTQRPVALYRALRPDRMEG